MRLFRNDLVNPATMSAEPQNPTAIADDPARHSPAPERDITVAFQGIDGANSEVAILTHLDERARPVPCRSFAELFDAVQSGSARYGLLPIENATAGSVNGAYELLMDNDFRIQREVIHHVHHALLALPGTAIEDVTLVRSHPQALAQCARYLKRHGMTPVDWYDTAGAARDLRDDAAASTAVIATERAAELYGLNILVGHIEDEPHNFTRFFVLGNDEPQRAEYNKTSLIFATRNEPSALYHCLGVFAGHDINITKLESRPRRSRPWEPVFFLDFEGHWQDEPCRQAVTELLQRASTVKMLGSYPAVRTTTVGI